jgi:hypothetical protein
LVNGGGVSLDGILRIQASGLALSKRLTATVDALPEITSGWDPRRAVCVEVDKMAQLLTITVSADWQRSLRPNELGPAIMFAKAAADAEYSAALEAASETAVGGSTTTAQAPDPEDNPLLDRAKAYGTTRRPADILEDLLADAAQSDSMPAESTADEWIIETPTQYSLTIESGILTDARIDANWASTRSVASINSALAKEIDDKKQSGTDGEAPGASTSDDIVELLAALLNLSNDAGTGGGRN